MQAPGGPEEDPSGGFEHGGWSVGHWDEQIEKATGESTSKPFDLVLGRKTDEIFAAHWPHTDDPGADLLNRATTHVASTTRNELEWENSKPIEGEVPDGVRALKERTAPSFRYTAARIWSRRCSSTKSSTSPA
jgi:dihydrofolate reductase